MSGETSSRDLALVALRELAEFGEPDEVRLEAAKELLHQCQPFVIDEEEAEDDDLWGQPRVRPLLPVGSSPPYEQAPPRSDENPGGPP